MNETIDREKKITEIKQALEKATQGPWKWIDPGGLERKKLVGEWEIMNFGIGGVYDQVAGSEPDEDDAHLIANAPVWLRFLLDELDRKDEENHKLREQRDSYYKSAQFAEAAAHGIEKLREENRKMIEGLRWYAEEQNYDGSEFRLSETEKDMGQRARDILHEIGAAVE